MGLFSRSPKGPAKLHIGSGDKRLEGWVNIDLKPLPGVDVVADVTRGLQFSDAEAVFAEHFLEHLRVDDAVRFLAECHRVLAPGGAVRISTPNLEWVWITHYALEGTREEKWARAVRLNRAFHGWGHRFVWNQDSLALALHACGFTEPRWCRYGESELAVFQGLERHETYHDTHACPHVIIAEARKVEARPQELASLLEYLNEEFLRHLAG
ncbi:MAG TPA: methyltransferase domain-containing protein [Thermoanaerobaculia bacterium]|nr:methyltransferase domain-containing protein [Thermoanaerobaculia bacterium]